MTNSEHSPATYPIENIDLAWDVAHAEQPHRDLALQSKRFGKLATADMLNDLALRDGAEAETNWVPASVRSDSLQSAEEGEQPERMSHEQLLELTNNYGFIVSGWFAASEVNDENHNRSVGFQSLYSENMPSLVQVDSFSNVASPMRTGDELMKSFTKHGVPELVTFAHQDNKVGRFLQKNHELDPKESDEPLVIMCYETADRQTDYNNPYSRDHKDAVGRSGNFFQALVLLSESRADEFRTAIERDPTVMHELIDTMMVERLGMDKGDWEKTRMPYDTWREINAGVERMAIRTDLTSTPETSQIIEF